MNPTLMERAMNSLNEPGGFPATTVRVTQGDVARVAGVHNTTVSLALRNSPALPESTRRRIQELAREMGYHPDPALRALVAYRNGRVKRDCSERIAYITNCDTRWGWRSRPADGQFHHGAVRKAGQLGYQLEHFWLSEPGLSARRLGEMLFHRGITGVLLASHRDEGDEVLDFDWSRMSAVKIGSIPQSPALHRVTDDPGGAVRLALSRVLARGYRRIGCILPQSWDAAADQAFSASFLMGQSRLSPGQRLPILFQETPRVCAGHMASDSECPNLVAWLEEHEPDVVIGCHASLGQALARAGISIPEDLRFVDLCLEQPDGRIAGVRLNRERVGEVAAEILVAQMQQNLLGVPAVPTATVVEAVWCGGESLPAALPAWETELLASG